MDAKKKNIQDGFIIMISMSSLLCTALWAVWARDKLLGPCRHPLTKTITKEILCKFFYSTGCQVNNSTFYLQATNTYPG